MIDRAGLFFFMKKKLSNKSKNSKFFCKSGRKYRTKTPRARKVHYFLHLRGNIRTEDKTEILQKDICG